MLIPDYMNERGPVFAVGIFPEVLGKIPELRRLWRLVTIPGDSV